MAEVSSLCASSLLVASNRLGFTQNSIPVHMSMQVEGVLSVGDLRTLQKSDDIPTHAIKQLSRAVRECKDTGEAICYPA